MVELLCQSFGAIMRIILLDHFKRSTCLMIYSTGSSPAVVEKEMKMKMMMEVLPVGTLTTRSPVRLKKTRKVPMKTKAKM